jgi:spermidine synthase
LGKKQDKRRNLKPDHKQTEKLEADKHSTGLYRRLFLISSAFLSGASIMIIEIAGNRILAPWFGNSLYTWVGLIGVILFSISVGYYLGGYLADRSPRYSLLINLLSISLFTVLLIPLIQPLIERLISPMSIIYGPIIASLILLALPGCFLGSISPFAIRLISLFSNDKVIGVSAGKIGMYATLGSIVGTFLTGFILIPHLEISTIFFVTSLLLMVLVTLGYVVLRPLKSGSILFVTLLVVIFSVLSLVLFFSEPYRDEDVVFEKTTFYHRIRVTEEDYNGEKLRTIYLDTTAEGAQFESSKEIPFRYQRYWELTKVMCPHLKDAAFLGGGGFAMPEATLDAFPKAQVDVIEIDPVVIDVGRKYFRVDEYPRLTPIADDARRYLRINPRKYDFIFGDAYNGVRYIPAHLVTLEFFKLVKSRLNDRGVYMMNIISSIEGNNSALFKSIMKTLSRVFRHVYVFVPHKEMPGYSQNIIILASDREIDIEASMNAYGPDTRIGQLLYGYVEPTNYTISDGSLLTDSYNPIEYIVSKSLL